MLKNKLLITVAVVMSLIGSSQAYGELTLDDMSMPKSPAYRVGISEIPENQYIEAKEDKNTISQSIENLTNISQTENNDITYADLSIKRLSREISQDLVYEEQDMVADLTLLWQGAAMQSDTINFALYKLANPDADKPDKNGVKKMLQSIASMSTLVGAGMANPLLAGTSFITGNVLGIMSQDTKALNYKYTKVTDADMIILIRKVEDLQQNAVNLYYDYMSAKNQLELTTKLVNDRKKRFETAQKNNAAKELVVITDAYYRTAVDKQRSAKSEFFSKRAALEQFVGNEAFTQFEEELAARDRGEQRKPQNEENQNEEYNQTIKDVENYKSNIDNIPENKLAYAIDDYNVELEKLPELRPMTTDIPKSTVQSNVNSVEKTSDKMKNNADTSKQEAKAAQKLAKQKAKEEKQNNKYSTKNLIFKHPNSVNNSNTVQQQSANTTAAQVQSPKQIEKFNGIDLLPLDEIKVPDLHKNGYSIFSEGAY